MQGEALKGRLIFCPDCRAESRLNVKKRYEGLKAAGFDYVCSFCGKMFKEAEIPFAEARESSLNKPREREVCEECKHYAKNVWVQKCMLHGKRVMALDSCNQFRKREGENGIL